MENSSLILKSWEANAQNWITTINHGEIESRVLATNSAIVECIQSFSPATILDVGCGEGWLSRELSSAGIRATGVDAIGSLVQDAIQKGGAEYFRYTYADISEGRHDLPGPFDAAVINFALIDKDSTEALIGYLPALLTHNGLLFIQTLHPFSVGDEAYESGWKEGSWKGMKQQFVLPYPWYFRTMEHWMEMFRKSGFVMEALREPLHPVTGKPLSVIFVLRKKAV